MTREELTTEFIQEQTGITIVTTDIPMAKVVVNNIEITSIDDWNKVTNSLIELQEENKKLKSELEFFKKIDNIPIDKYKDEIERINSICEELEEGGNNE